MIKPKKTSEADTPKEELPLKQKVSNVIDDYPELYHYTTAIGLQGIISSNSLWATHFEYINDSQEFKGYFQHRLPAILHECILTPIKESYNTDMLVKRRLDETGGLDASMKIIEDDLVEAITRALQTVYEPYFFSFSGATKQAPDDGLLSQWRGYGSDGGYAIVFDTKGIDELIKEEVAKYHYTGVHWGEVHYHDHRSNVKSVLPEVQILEKEVIDALTKYMYSTKIADLESIIIPVLGLSTMYKHIGFREEAEVRIVAIPIKSEFKAKIDKNLNQKLEFKNYILNIKNGTLVPVIELKGAKKLPIIKVIVGPHPDKLKRKKSVEIMLQQYGIGAKVIVSDIPYIGK